MPIRLPTTSVPIVAPGEPVISTPAWLLPEMMFPWPRPPTTFDGPASFKRTPSVRLVILVPPGERPISLFVNEFAVAPVPKTWMPSWLLPAMRLLAMVFPEIVLGVGFGVTPLIVTEVLPRRKIPSAELPIADEPVGSVPIALPSIRLPWASLTRRMPSSELPEITLAAPDTLPPMVLESALLRMTPATALGIAAIWFLALKATPIQFPSMRLSSEVLPEMVPPMLLPVVPEMKTPLLWFPEMMLRVPWVVPPIVI